VLFTFSLTLCTCACTEEKFFGKTSLGIMMAAILSNDKVIEEYSNTAIADFAVTSKLVQFHLVMK
jgi:hypothetical protein